MRHRPGRVEWENCSPEQLNPRPRGGGDPHCDCDRWTGAYVRETARANLARAARTHHFGLTMDSIPLDPVAAALLAQMSAAGAPALEDMSAPQARAAMGALKDAFWPEPPPVRITDVGPEAEAERALENNLSCALRTYRPARADEAPLPGLIFFHGGGWTLGDLDTYDAMCAALAEEGGLCVVSVDYRLAPEHPFPAAFDDALASTEWIVRHAARLGIDADRLAVGGDSAGGALAAAVALAFRDRAGHLLKAQMLLYPVVDLASESASYVTLGAGYVLSASAMRWFRNNYLKNKDHSGDWRASPLLAASHADLPPALVLTCGYDPLRDEGIAYVDRLRCSGVTVFHHHAGNQMHGFLQWGGVLPAAGPAIHQCARTLATLLTPRP
jgi:acetyl esterase